MSFLSTTNVLIDGDVYLRLFAADEETKKSLENLQLSRSTKEADDLHSKMSRGPMGNFGDNTSRDTLVALAEDSYEFDKGLQKNSKVETKDFSKYLVSISEDVLLAARTVIKSMPTDDIDTQTRIIENIFNKNKAISEIAVWVMRVHGPSTPGLEEKAFPLLIDSDPARRIDGTTVFENSSSEKVQVKIIEMTNDSDGDVSKTARDVLIFATPANDEIKAKTQKIAKKSPDQSSRLLTKRTVC